MYHDNANRKGMYLKQGVGLVLSRGIGRSILFNSGFVSLGLSKELLGLEGSNTARS